MTEKKPPLCRYCGGRIAKQPKTVWLRQSQPIGGVTGSKFVVVEEYPTTIAQCQRLTNDKILSVRKSDSGNITRFSTWDGETYVDKFFCNGAHARNFAYVCAHAGHVMKSYTAAKEKQ